MTLEIPPINLEHYEALLSANFSVQWTAKASPKDWAKSVNSSKNLEAAKIADAVVCQLPQDKLTRASLREFISTTHNAEARYLAIMAWGGMKPFHGADSLKSRTLWIPIVEALSKSTQSRAKDFETLIQHRPGNASSELLSGIGVAYFTKLMFFLRPRADAYILDQWTAKSVNLLFSVANQKAPIVKLYGDTVNDRNTSRDYEVFCKCVEKLATKLKTSPADTEERIFSNGGGKGKDGAWRAYVKSKWSRSQ